MKIILGNPFAQKAVKSLTFGIGFMKAIQLK